MVATKDLQALIRRAFQQADELTATMMALDEFLGPLLKAREKADNALAAFKEQGEIVDWGQRWARWVEATTKGPHVRFSARGIEHREGGAS